MQKFQSWRAAAGVYVAVEGVTKKFSPGVAKVRCTLAKSKAISRCDSDPGMASWIRGEGGND
jgi:hypothetical protein